jgi:hypothetical protein
MSSGWNHRPRARDVVGNEPGKALRLPADRGNLPGGRITLINLSACSATPGLTPCSNDRGDRFIGQFRLELRRLRDLPRGMVRNQGVQR